MSASIESALAGAPSIAAARVALEEDPAQSWIVGGAIRDALLGEGVFDADLAIERGREEPAARAIARIAGGFAFALSTEHATWRAVSSSDGWHVDVAALRAETIEADLRARDFTVNAIATPLAVRPRPPAGPDRPPPPPRARGGAQPGDRSDHRRPGVRRREPRHGPGW